MRNVATICLTMLAAWLLFGPSLASQGSAETGPQINLASLESIEGVEPAKQPEVIEPPVDPDPLDVLRDDVEALRATVGNLSAEVAELKSEVAKLKESAKPTPADQVRIPLLKRDRVEAPALEPIKATLVVSSGECVWCDKFKVEIQPKLEAIGWVFTEPEVATSGTVPRLKICHGSGCVEVPNGWHLFDVDALQARVPKKGLLPAIKSVLPKDGK